MRLIGLALAFGLTVLPHVADGQSAGKTPRLCFLTFDPGTPQSPSPRFEGFFAGLRDLGYVHGKTITIDYLVADGRSEKFPELAAECVRLKADIVVRPNSMFCRTKPCSGRLPVPELTEAPFAGVGNVSDSGARAIGGPTNMTRTLGILVMMMLGVALAGCTSGPYFWIKPSAALPEFERDHGVCFKDATIGYGVGSEKAYKACMASKGWTRAQTRTGLPDDRHFRGVEGDDEFARSMSQEEHREQLLKEQQQRAADELACSRGPASRPPGLVCR